jgi:hypothetical protein
MQAKTRFGLALLVAALLAAGCAGASQAPEASPSSRTKTVTIALDRFSTTVTISEGDTLVVSPATVTGPMEWTVVTTPPQIQPTPASEKPPFRFLARHAGIGELRLTLGPHCNPMADQSGGPKCPLSAQAGGMPIRLYTVTVKVLGQG